MFAIERDDLASLRALLFLAVIGGVGLASDNKHLAHTDMLDRCLTKNFVTVESPQFEAIPSACGKFQGRSKSRFLKGRHQFLPFTDLSIGAYASLKCGC